MTQCEQDKTQKDNMAGKAWNWIQMTHQLRHQESKDQQEPRTLHKWPVARPCHKDKGLTDCANLKVHRRGKLLKIILGSFLKAFDMEQSLQISNNDKDEHTEWSLKTLIMLNKLQVHTGKKSVLYAAQKKMTVIMAK